MLSTAIGSPLWRLGTWMGIGWVPGCREARVAAVVADQAAEVVLEVVVDQVAEGVLVVEVVVPVEGTEKVVLVGVSAGDLKIRSFKWVEK